MSEDSPEVAQALDIARDLIKSGVPIFLAPPCPSTCRRPGHDGGAGTGGSGFDLPAGWETAVPMPEVVDNWRLGWAMAAVCGHVIDVLDVDPRNGGDVAAEELRTGGVWPRTYGVAATPSGGTHELIRTLGVRKGTPYPGVDLQAGTPAGEGRGFVFIAPTVKISKVDGVPRPYRWVEVPDLDSLAEWGADDDSGAVIATAVATVRARPSIQEGSIAPVELSGSEAVRLKAYADTAIARELAHLRAATPGSRNSAAFRTACSLVEIANSPWSGIRIEQVLAEFERATALIDRPDDRFTPAEAYDAWTSALNHVNGRGRPQPEERSPGLRLSWDDVGGMPPFSQAGYTPALSQGLPISPGPTSPNGSHGEPQSATISDDPFVTTGAIPAQRTGSESYGSAPTVGNLTPARRPLRLLTSADLDQIPPPQWLVQDILTVDSTAWIIGRPGHAKSFVSLDLALCVATGQRWMGREVLRGAAVYVVGEGMHGTRPRVRAWEKVRNGEVQAEGIYFIDAAEEGLVLGSPAWQELLWTVSQVRPALVVVDTQARVTVGVEENSSKEMGIVIAEFDRLRRLGGGSTLLSVHHQGHAGQQARGSSAMLGAAQTEITVTKKERLVTVRITKQKDAEPSEPIELHLDSIPVGLSSPAPSVAGDPWVVPGKPITGGVLRPAGASEKATAEEILALDNRERLVAILRDVFGRRGGTKAEIKKIATGQYEINEKTFHRIWNQLLDGVIAKVVIDDRPTNNYTLRSFGDSGEFSSGVSQDHSEEVVSWAN